MYWWRWLLIVTLGCGSGAYAYRLLGTERADIAAGMSFMCLLTAWFTLGDLMVDEQLQKDAKEATRDARAWGEDK